MLNYILGVGILIIPLYFYKNKLLYYFLLYYDKVLNYKFKKNNISFTGISDQSIVTKNNINEIDDFDIKLVNFYVNNNLKRKFYKNDLDLTMLNHLPNYNSQIILATIDLYNNDKLIIKDLDFTNELNEFLIYDSILNLTNSKLDKLLWISLINHKFNYDYSKDLTIKYKLMKDDISIIGGENINLLVKDGNLTYL